ncbi:hypothetical protein A2757_00940 [Candidatus Giovannonibacteria bacterium RIFCSPHIGHO2_01_FULL_48_47]|nr:MAG: hypothetical protein A2757_00940 [Candidatus Giovannonibacteria bacterium RIFCSPHIGHO2_01_FULL_48_47]OGF67637.1 MAG: hypothetical protein A3D61_02020 [Candidatus Giovannonibacteria bacterium RIFCSPHIGHO2_02_FULL_48_15]OGF89801.1 MAG: hypothetical protein A3B26_01795 [Candidatus Giovannonibacteria bacterium RIFCSPLOWO2_01_FULL_48_47]OGF95415.1 MAG: hypothetical protein A2433_00660 [Candidatus Giovannonibacteria bacterium RIFOXYC1_FULL_48_8]OGF95962.1 MAG: hypothetical protein A2613_00090
MKLMRRHIKILIFLAVLAGGLSLSGSEAQASHCAVAASGTGYLFENFESAEYVNGLLVLHFKTKIPFPQSQRFRTNLSFLTDECRNGTNSSFEREVFLTTGIQNFSIRFTSTTTFEIWNDEADVKENCFNCTQEIFASFPGYYEVIFRAFTADSGSDLNSSSYKIFQNAPGPPVKNETLPTPEACASKPFGNFDAEGFFFDFYERAEYVDGLLVFHFRLLPPSNDGRNWFSQVRLFDQNCEGLVDGSLNPLTFIKPFSRYYSVRFASTTHYDIWNDEAGTKETCPACSLDLPATPGGSEAFYVSFFYSIVGPPGTSNFLSSTPFPIREPGPAKPDPVIIIPGILGSSEKNDEFVIDPIFHTYDDLIRLLDEAGYTPGEDLFTFPYNWEQPVSLNGDELGQKIQEIKNICGCSKVDIIAHSMGGLVVRSYAQGNSYQNNIDQIIFVGTPHEGSSFAYLLWDGGDLTPVIPPTTSDRFLELWLNMKSIFSGFTSKFSYIRNNVFSVQDLLPIYNYLKDDDTGIVRNYPENYPRNLLLELLNSASSEARLNERGIRITNIAGNIEPNFVDGEQIDLTLGNIRVVDDPSRLPKWEHGYPENYEVPFTDHGLEFVEGDGRVSINSTIHSFASIGITKADIDLHSNLIKGVAWPEISKALFGTPAPEELPQIAINDILVIPVFSPVDIQVVDPLGRRVGKDFGTGGELNEISLAFYSGTEEEFVTIPNPLDGEYKIQTQGTGSGGSYTVEINYITEATSTVAEFTGETAPGVVSDIDFTFTSSTPETLGFEITIDDVIADVEMCYDLGWITKKSVKKNLIKELEKIIKKKKEISQKTLEGFIKKLEKNHPKHINDQCFNLLKEDVEWLWNN